MARAQLTETVIVATAAALIDEEGLAALSMRKLAARLGVPVMNLYHYVATRSEVLDRVAEHAFQDLVPRDVMGGTARDELAALFGGLFDYLQAHPGLAALFADRALSGPAVYRAADRALAVLLAAGLDPKSAVDGFTNLLAFTLGAAQYTLARSAPSAIEATVVYRERLDQVDPTMLPALASVRGYLIQRNPREQFQRGLLAFIDGIVSDA